jgi:hypothetical protein
MIAVIATNPPITPPTMPPIAPLESDCLLVADTALVVVSMTKFGDELGVIKVPEVTVLKVVCVVMVIGVTGLAVLTVLTVPVATVAMVVVVAGLISTVAVVVIWLSKVTVVVGLSAAGLQQLSVPQHTNPAAQNFPVVGQHTLSRG